MTESRVVPREAPSRLFWTACVVVELLLWTVGRYWGHAGMGWDSMLQQDTAVWVPHWSIGLAMWVLIPGIVIVRLAVGWLRAARFSKSRPAV